MLFEKLKQSGRVFTFMDKGWTGQQAFFPPWLYSSAVMRAAILKIIDFFYIPLAARWVPRRTFRYVACGGFSNALDICLFYVSYHYILHEHMVHLGQVTVSAPIMAFLMAFCVSFPTGFSLSKYVVFPESELRGRTQLIRYIFIVCCCISLNYIFLKFFVEVCGIFPTIAKVFTAILIACFSYLTQKHFTFRIKGRQIRA